MKLIKKPLKIASKPDPLESLLKHKQQMVAIKMYEREAKKLEKELRELEGNTATASNPADIALLQSYLEWIKSLPEELRPTATQLVASTLQPRVVQSGNDLPMLMLMLMFIQQMQNLKENNKKDNGGQVQVILKNIEMLMKQMELQSQERLEQMKQLYSIISKNNNNTNLTDVVKALSELKTTTSDELLKALIAGLIEVLSKNDPVEQLMKYQKAGLILDPKTLLELKREDRKYELEKYKIDKSAEIDIKKIELEQAQIEKASEFIAQLGQTIHELTSGELTSGEEKEKKEIHQNIAMVCPNCNTLVNIPAAAGDGYEVECPGCKKRLRVRRSR